MTRHTRAKGRRSGGLRCRTRRTGAATPAFLPGAFLGVLGMMALLAAAGCVQDMANQPRKEPLEASRFFADGSSARQPVPGTVARGELEHDEVFHTGKRGDDHADSLPFPLTLEVLERGRERYDIFCSPCHDRAGRGDGMVVRRGFRQPASLHSERLRGEPVGYYVDVMTNGFGAMSSYAGQVAPRDRWAIAAYIRALQLSQQAGLDDVPAAYREALERGRSVRIEDEDPEPASRAEVHR